VKFRLLIAIVFGFALSAAATAQNSSTGQAGGQAPAQGSGGWQGQEQGQAQHAFRPMPGTVIEIGDETFTIKTVEGETYTVNIDMKTRIVKPEGESKGPCARRDVGNPAHLLNPDDIHVGDFIIPMGEADPDTRSVNAKVIRKVDPELAMQIRERQNNYNKTWLAGEVKAVTGAKITLLGSMDHAPHTVVANEDTTFSKHHQHITLADIQAGDKVRVEGAVRKGIFVATSVVSVDTLGPPTTAPRATPPPTPPPTQTPTQSPSQPK